LEAPLLFMENKFINKTKLKINGKINLKS